MLYLGLNGFNINKFQSEVNYYNRDNYQNLISFIIDSKPNLDTKFISTNTPGLGYYIKRPVLDLLAILNYRSTFNSSFLYNDNLTYVFTKLISNKFEYIIALNSSHVYYEPFENQFSSISIYRVAFNITLSKLIYFNNEFKLYQLNETS